jgi:hypothetical protein
MVMLRHPRLPAAVLAAALVSLCVPTPPSAAAESPDSLSQVRALLAKGRVDAAIVLLEESLAERPPDRQAPVLELLREAYATAAQKAAAERRPADAERFRDNLEILNHGRVIGRTEADIRPGRGAPELPAARPLDLPPSDPPRPPAPPAPDEPAGDLAAADAAFRARRYDQAGQLYEVLDRQGRLPAARRDHWAYCRWVAVVQRINSRPATQQQWDEIDAEIQQIRALSPNNWYGEYLRNRAAERSAGARTGKSRSNRLVIRGSAPEEPDGSAAPVKPAPPRDALVASQAKAGPPIAGGPGPARRPASPPGAAQRMDAVRPPSGGPVRWKIRETASFRILHDDAELAERAAEVAEAARESQIRRWAGSPPKTAWTPKCDLYLYPNARVFCQMTGQPEESPGFSTMGMNGGRIIARRVNLRADHPQMLKAIMPHEITHVVLADLFPHKQIPRWADEGMAVLSEPPSEQQSRAADLHEPLGSGQLFKVDKLMNMDYPESRYWGLYYAQSVSLTRYLVEQGTPTQFIQFVQSSQQTGPDDALRRIYRIDGLNQLHERWLAYARTNTAAATASAAPDEASSSRAR